MPQPLFLDAPVATPTGSLWAIVIPVVLGLVAVYVLLPRPRGYPPWWGAIVAGLALVAAGFLLFRVGGAVVEMVLFYVFSAIALVAGGLLITQQNPVRAALSFALVVLSTCGLFLLQAAPFLMAATIIIYAGAIIVTFLFVIMLAQQAGLSDADARSREPFLSCVAGFVLLGAILFVLHSTYTTKELDDLLRSTEQAMQQPSAEGVQSALGVKRDFFERFHREAERDGTSAKTARQLRAALDDLESEWKDRGDDVHKMKLALARLYAAGAGDRQGAESLPKENVAYLGLSLFTEYLLAVELGGTLLLVATIGAIAITARRAERLR